MKSLKAFINDFVYLFKSNSISESIAEIKKSAIEDTASLLHPYGKTIVMIVKTVHDIPMLLFWSKIERFLRGIDSLSCDERQRIIERFADDGNEEYVKRLICLIDDMDVDDKIDFIANLTKALAEGFIDTDMYFRLIHSIKNTLYEDLLYLKQNVRNNEIPRNINIVSLEQTGLAYQSVIGGEGVYEVSDLGTKVVYYGVEYDNMDQNEDLHFKLGSPISIPPGLEPLKENVVNQEVHATWK